MKNVFFDIGGTLLAPRRIETLHSPLKEWGTERPVGDVREAYRQADLRWEDVYGRNALLGQEAEKSFNERNKIVFTLLGLGDRADLMERFDRDARRSWVKDKLYPDAEPCLRKLRDEGFRVGLISNASPPMQGVVERLGLNRYAEVVVISELVGMAKPDPAIFHHTMRLSNVDPADSVYVGDFYKIDVVGARGAGMEGVLIDREGRYDGGVDCPTIASLDGLREHLDD